MATGVLITESLRIGAELSDAQLSVSRIRKVAVSQAAPEQPSVWTLIDFSIPDSIADRLAGLLVEALEPGPWYVDFHTDSESFIVFPGKAFRYLRGDERGRKAAVNHGVKLNIPAAQLDWVQ